MSALDRGLRRELAKSVRRARKTAEAGARKALTALTVAAAEPDSSLSAEERALRRRLRAHGRQLGDLRQGAEQEVGRLAHEVAYEHWHRMLFARFLAENGLLVEPVHEVPVSLDECRDIARESRRDIWAVAAEFAAKMLPRIFRPDNPSLAVRLPPETQRELEKTLAGLPSAVFLADDALGWTYQFWQADRKDEVNRSGVKIGADELPAVTQLFTEPYMVRFLFHNTVGAWRAGRLLADRPELAENAESEDDLRRAVQLEAVGGYDFDYLRFVREPGNGTDDGNAFGPWRPAAGSFDKWPTRAAELRILDPCCGSGHFLVEGLHLFVRLRMEEENLSLRDAIGAVLRDNLRGLEIDPRCAQVAAFSVAFAAWKLAEKAIELPPLRIACSGLAPNAARDEWIALAERAAGAAGSAPDKTLYRTQDTLVSGALRQTFGTLHDLFAQAPTLGSLIEPRHADTSIFGARFDAIHPLLDSVLAEAEAEPECREQAVAAAGMAGAADLLAETYSLVITNVPYLSRQRQSVELATLLGVRYPSAKHDLATAFLMRIFALLGESGVEALVVPQNWLFLKAYRKLRRGLLSQRQWRFVARLGEHAFQDTSAAGAFAAMTIVSADSPVDGWEMAGVDASTRGKTRFPTREKADSLRITAEVHLTPQASLRVYPDAVILIRLFDESVPLLETLCDGLNGTTTGDYARFGRKFWESTDFAASWVPQQSTVAATRHFGGREHVVHSGHGGTLAENPGATIRGKSIWKKQGVAVSQIRNLSATLYTGEHFDNNVSALGPLNDAELAAIWCFCATPEYTRSVREIDQALKVTNASLVKVPFDLDRWKTVAAKRYPKGLPEPYSDDPTQWIFHGHPCGSVVWDEDTKRTAEGPLRSDATVLQVAVVRLLGYRWPAERDPEMRLADEQRAWIARCADLHEFADEDGIVCLPAVGGEAPAADRLRSLLAAAYGNDWDTTVERRLLRAAAGGQADKLGLDDWLRRDFFKAHCSLFHQRPLVWHIWDGLPDGFHALVNYHRLASPHGEGHRTLESITYRYLGDWISRQHTAQDDGTPRAQRRLVAAQRLQYQLEKILEGESPLDIFVRWKPLHRQSVGWEPDINDGVRLNIRPFIRAKLTNDDRGAGLLRAKPTIHWKKDRGAEPQKPRINRKGKEKGKDSLPKEIRPKKEFPWFWAFPGTGAEDERTDFMGGREFDGKRWNDLHYTLAAKRAARERHGRDAADRPSEDAVASGAGTEGETA